MSNINMNKNQQLVGRKVSRTSKDVLEYLASHKIVSEYDYESIKSIKKRYNLLVEGKNVYTLVNSINHQSTFILSQSQELKRFGGRFDAITQKWFIILK